MKRLTKYDLLRYFKAFSSHSYSRLNAELLVHSEVNANKLGFSGLSPKILLYKRVKWFKTFYDKIKPLIESKDSKTYFCNKFIICRLNMYLKVLLYYLRFILYVIYLVLL